MNDRKYLLKKGTQISLFGSPDIYTNDNLTDEKAAELLASRPKLARSFERINGKPAADWSPSKKPAPAVKSKPAAEIPAPAVVTEPVAEPAIESPEETAAPETIEKAADENTPKAEEGISEVVAEEPVVEAKPEVPAPTPVKKPAPAVKSKPAKK